MNKLIELCELFSCSMDQLVREDICVNEEVCSEIRTEKIPLFIISDAPLYAPSRRMTPSVT